MRYSWSLAVLGALALAHCRSTPVQPPIAAAYGTVPGQRTFDPANAEHFIRDAGYPRGVFAVPLDHDKLFAIDADSINTGICSRIDAKPFELPNGNIKYYRFRCDSTFTGRSVVFLTGTDIAPTRGETLEWKPLAGEAPLTWSRADKPADLHHFAAVASPKLLNGNVLVSAAWFTGTYPPAKERDELRGGELMAFGNYKVWDRALFIGPSPNKPATFLLKASDPQDVREGLEWALLPGDASEKTRASVSVIYEIPNGYLLRVTQFHDHEGAGADDSVFLYAYENGRWRFLASAEQTRMY